MGGPPAVSVIKIGGAALASGGGADDLAQAVLAAPSRSILVHGGGPELDSLQRRLGQTPVKIDGMRRTDDATLQSALMTLCGLVNKRLVGELLRAGVPAFGLSGVDGGVLRCRKRQEAGVDLGWVGEIVDVRTDLLAGILDLGLVPVMASISLGLDGSIYNVNADQAASAVARAMAADRLDFVSDVPGILVDGEPTVALDEEEVERLAATGDIHQGMLPKIEAALGALRAGVPQVRIVDIEGLMNGGGTAIRRADRPTPPHGGGNVL
jgi:acetylglutamate kinase